MPRGQRHAKLVGDIFVKATATCCTAERYFLNDISFAVQLDRGGTPVQGVP